MITDKNILASKATKGLWYYHKNTFMHGKFKDHYKEKELDFEINQYDESVFGNPIIATVHSDGVVGSHEENEANAYIISAAPEAIEFIADLMEFFNFLELLETDKINIEPWRNKAEKILKKGYNL